MRVEPLGALGCKDALVLDQATFDAVDAFVEATIAPGDEALAAAVAAAEEAGLPAIQVTAAQGALLALLVRLVDGREVLEVGTLGGYSSILMARALAPGGRLTSLEVSPEYAAVARANVERAGLAEAVEVRVGPALETLSELEADGAGPYDLVFIDADKANTPSYFAWALDRTRAGGLIVADNVVRDGSLAEAESSDPATLAQRRLHEMLAEEPRVSATTIQTVGAKGYDGFLVALVGDA